MNDEHMIIFKTDDGAISLDVRMEEDTVLLTLDQMAKLFGKSRSTINEHVLNIYAKGELAELDSKKKIENSDFSTKLTHYYDLDVIISVGYRDIQFRQ